MEAASNKQGLLSQHTIKLAVGRPLRELEKTIILQTLKYKKYNRTHTAKALGIGIRTLQRKLNQYRAEILATC